MDGSGGDLSTLDLRELLVWAAALLIGLPAAYFSISQRRQAVGEQQQQGAGGSVDATGMTTAGVANK